MNDTDFSQTISESIRVNVREKVLLIYTEFVEPNLDSLSSNNLSDENRQDGILLPGISTTSFKEFIILCTKCMRVVEEQLRILIMTPCLTQQGLRTELSEYIYAMFLSLSADGK